MCLTDDEILKTWLFQLICYYTTVFYLVMPHLICIKAMFYMCIAMQHCAVTFFFLIIELEFHFICSDLRLNYQRCFLTGFSDYFEENKF